MDSKKTLCSVGLKMCQHQLVVACDGNLSYRRSDGNIVITPSGVPKGELSPDMLLLIDPDGKIIKGNGKPSSEMNMHLAIYRRRTDVKAVIHAHPIVSTAVTVAGIEFPYNVVTESRDFLGPVATVPYAEPASIELAETCAEALYHVNVILMENHGAVTVGDNLLQALYRMETLEAAATIYRDALSMYSALHGSSGLKPFPEKN